MLFKFRFSSPHWSTRSPFKYSISEEHLNNFGTPDEFYFGKTVMHVVCYFSLIMVLRSFKSACLKTSSLCSPNKAGSA